LSRSTSVIGRFWVCVVTLDVNARHAATMSVKNAKWRPGMEFERVYRVKIRPWALGSRPGRSHPR
jgi:hypothetical protein